MALSAAALVRGPGEIAVMVVEVTRRMFRRPFQWREFVEPPAWPGDHARRAARRLASAARSSSCSPDS